ncbi:MAG: PEGA domain-containing protein [Planctomycetes bacterium]|nr:PEGA domain-containing protein [Planctomycetota bacterium]
MNTRNFLFDLLFCVTFLCGSTGCVERKLFIQSDPPSASVYIDGRAQGKTPVSLPFNYYGCRQVELRLRGYQVKNEQVHISPPWYQFFILDFFFDVLWPGTLEDVHAYSFTLNPYEAEPLQEKEEILERAEELRYETATP